MAAPVLIDTDMGADDAVAVALALSAGQLDLVGLAAVGGNVDLDQAVANIGRILRAIDPPVWPRVGRGLDQTDARRLDARALFGRDGLGQADLPEADALPVESYLGLYRDLLGRYAGRLQIVAIGPLTNLAAVLRQEPELLGRAQQIVIMGGAVWCPGNVDGVAEFNFYRDPQAAADVLSAGLPVTLVPLDVTRQVVFDESHLARLAASGSRAARMLAKILPDPMSRDVDGMPGRLCIHDAVAVGSLLWPELFLQTKLAVEVATGPPHPGRSTPAIGKEPACRASVLISVRQVDLLENVQECLCHERFVV